MESEGIDQEASRNEQKTTSQMKSKLGSAYAGIDVMDKAINRKSRYERGRTRDRMKIILEKASSRIPSLPG